MSKSAKQSKRRSNDRKSPPALPVVASPSTSPHLDGGAVRALATMANDIVDLEETTALVSAQFRALAKRCGVFVREAEPV